MQAPLFRRSKPIPEEPSNPRQEGTEPAESGPEERPSAPCGISEPRAGPPAPKPGSAAAPAPHICRAVHRPTRQCRVGCRWNGGHRCMMRSAPQHRAARPRSKHAYAHAYVRRHARCPCSRTRATDTPHRPSPTGRRQTAAAVCIFGLSFFCGRHLATGECPTGCKITKNIRKLQFPFHDINSKSSTHNLSYKTHNYTDTKD